MRKGRLEKGKKYVENAQRARKQHLSNLKNFKRTKIKEKHEVSVRNCDFQNSKRGNSQKEKNLAIRKSSKSNAQTEENLAIRKTQKRKFPKRIEKAENKKGNQTKTGK